MAEAAAAFYAVETAVEGAAVGAFAVSKPTNNHHLKFQKLKSPSPSLGRSSHSLNIIKGKAYIFGGDLQDSGCDDAVRCITLPSDLALNDLDYQLIKPQAAPGRPLAAYSDDPNTPQNSETNKIPVARSAHAATSVDSDVYIFGGRQSKSPSTTSSDPLNEQGVVHRFSTITNTWTTLYPHQTRCQQGVPEPRSHASLAGTPHPLPDKSLDINTTDHGTLFLHGGYNRDRKLLRDVWTFDVSSRVWGRWPDPPDPGPEDVAGEGQIICTGSRLWRVGDGFGKMMYLEIVRDDTNDQWSKGELGVSPKTGEWVELDFGETATAEEETEKGQGPTTWADHLPSLRRGAGFVPLTTGGGRQYLMYMMGEDAPSSMVPDIWSFQIDPDKRSLAQAKDSIRTTVGASSGENRWARCDVVESTKDEGVVERPQPLSRFAVHAWRDFGAGVVVIWGGTTADGEIRNEGWVVTVD